MYVRITLQATIWKCVLLFIPHWYIGNTIIGRKGHCIFFAFLNGLLDPLVTARPGQYKGTVKFLTLFEMIMICNVLQNQFHKKTQWTSVKCWGCFC